MKKYEQEYFTKIVKMSFNLSDVCRRLNLKPYKGNRDTVKKFINIYKLDTSHFMFNPNNTRKSNKYELKEILVKNSSYTDTTKMKNRLYNEGLKNRCCEICGQDENWCGMKISLRLDHINGINNDNRLENLRIICPNCDAGLDTFSGKNIKKSKYKYKSIIKTNYCDCGNIISYSATKCQNCSSKSQRKVDRPSLEQLELDITELGYCGTGRKYDVSDNSIRKWLKGYKNN